MVRVLQQAERANRTHYHVWHKKQLQERTVVAESVASCVSLDEALEQLRDSPIFLIHMIRALPHTHFQLAMIIDKDLCRFGQALVGIGRMQMLHRFVQGERMKSEAGNVFCHEWMMAIASAGLGAAQLADDEARWERLRNMYKFKLQPRRPPQLEPEDWYRLMVFAVALPEFLPAEFRNAPIPQVCDAIMTYLTVASRSEDVNLVAKGRKSGTRSRLSSQPTRQRKCPPQHRGEAACPGSAISDAQPLWQEAWTDHFMAISGNYDGNQITLINIYGSQDKNERDQLFESLQNRPRPKGLVIIGGDFNCVIDPELDRSRLTRGSTEESALRDLTENWLLVDANAEQQVEVRSDADKVQYYADYHTFRYKVGEDGLASSRLDRWYLSSQWMHRIALLEVTPPAAASDHDAVWLIIKDEDRQHETSGTRGRKAIRYPLLLLSVKSIVRN